MQANDLVQVDVRMGPSVVEHYWPDTARTTNLQSLSPSQREVLNDVADAAIEALAIEALQFEALELTA